MSVSADSFDRLSQKIDEAKRTIGAAASASETELKAKIEEARKNADERAAELSASAADPLLVSVRYCAWLVEFIGCVKTKRLALGAMLGIAAERNWRDSNPSICISMKRLRGNGQLE